MINFNLSTRKLDLVRVVIVMLQFSLNSKFGLGQTTKHRRIPHQIEPDRICLVALPLPSQVFLLAHRQALEPLSRRKLAQTSH